MPLAFSSQYSCYGPDERPPRVPTGPPKWEHASIFAVCGVPQKAIIRRPQFARDDLRARNVTSDQLCAEQEELLPPGLISEVIVVTPLGWIVEVEQIQRPLLYAVGVADPGLAVRLVRDVCSEAKREDVRAFRPIRRLPTGLLPGQVTGPF